MLVSGVLECTRLLFWSFATRVGGFHPESFRFAEKNAGNEFLDFMMDDFLWEVEKFSLLSWLWFVVGNLSPKKGIFSIF